MAACRLCGRKPALRTVWGALCGDCSLTIMEVGNRFSFLHSSSWIAYEALGKLKAEAEARLSGKAVVLLLEVGNLTRKIHSDALVLLENYRMFLRELVATAKEE